MELEARWRQGGGRWRKSYLEVEARWRQGGGGVVVWGEGGGVVKVWSHLAQPRSVMAMWRVWWAASRLGRGFGKGE